MACAYADGPPPGDAKGVIAAYQYWNNLGHEVAIFIKQFRISNKNPDYIMKNIDEFREKIPSSAIAKIPGKADDDAYFIDFCLDEGAILVTNDKLRDHNFKNLLMASALDQGKSEEEVNKSMSAANISKFARLDEVKKVAENLGIKINNNLPIVKKFRNWSNHFRCEYTFALGKFRPSPDFRVGSEPIKSSKSSNLSDSTVNQLKKIANERGLIGYSRLNKSELIKLIEAPPKPSAEPKSHNTPTSSITQVPGRGSTQYPTIKGFSSSKGSGKPSIRFPQNPLDTLSILNHIESRRDSEYVWSAIKKEFQDTTSLAKTRVNAVFSRIAGATKIESNDIDWSTFPQIIDIPDIIESYVISILQTNTHEYEPETFDSLSRYFLEIKNHIKSQAHSENMTEDLAVSTVLDIVGVPVSSRLVKPMTNVWFWLSWLRGSRKTTTYQTSYANVGHHFKELTGHKLKSIFSSPEDICKRIAQSFPSLNASVTPHPNNELVIVATH